MCLIPLVCLGAVTLMNSTSFTGSVLAIIVGKIMVLCVLSGVLSQFVWRDRTYLLKHGVGVAREKFKL